MKKDKSVKKSGSMSRRGAGVVQTDTKVKKVSTSSGKNKSVVTRAGFRTSDTGSFMDDSDYMNRRKEVSKNGRTKIVDKSVVMPASGFVTRTKEKMKITPSGVKTKSVSKVYASPKKTTRVKTKTNTK